MTHTLESRRGDIHRVRDCWRGAIVVVFLGVVCTGFRQRSIHVVNDFDWRGVLCGWIFEGGSDGT